MSNGARMRIAILLTLALLAAFPAFAETVEPQGDSVAAVLEEAPAVASGAESAAPPERADAPPAQERGSQADAADDVRAEYHIYYGEDADALAEYTGGGFPAIRDGGLQAAAPELPESIQVDGVEYLPVCAEWTPEEAQIYSAVYLRTIETAAYRVRHCWLGDPDAAICEDVTGTAPVGSRLYYDAQDEVRGYAYVRSENAELTIDADPGRNVIVLYYSRRLVLASQSAEKVYDGTPLNQNEVHLTGALKDGDELVVLLSGSITAAGTAPNRFDTVRITRDGQDVTSSGEYDIVLEEGALTVLPAGLEITAASARERSDGTPLTCDRWALSDGMLAEGESIASVQVRGAQTEVGESPNVPSGAIILDASGADVTANYDIRYCDGTLSVTDLQPLTVIARSAEKIYDGTPLEDAGFRCEGLMDGDAIEVCVRGSITAAGIAENEIEGVMITRDGREVTGEYEIALHSGALRVLPREIEITAGSARKRFDGAPLTCDAWALSAGALAQGDVLESVRVTGSQSGVGESENLPDAAVIRSAGGTDVTDSYAITYVRGTLCVADGGSGD